MYPTLSRLRINGPHKHSNATSSRDQYQRFKRWALISTILHFTHMYIRTSTYLLFIYDILNLKVKFVVVAMFEFFLWIFRSTCLYSVSFSMFEKNSLEFCYNRVLHCAPSRRDHLSCRCYHLRAPVFPTNFIIHPIFDARRTKFNLKSHLLYSLREPWNCAPTYRRKIKISNDGFQNYT